MTGFWVGMNDLFRHNTEIKWDWTNNQYMMLWNDSALMYENNEMDEEAQMPGICLVLGITQEAETKFHLQYSPCKHFESFVFLSSI